MRFAVRTIYLRYKIDQRQAMSVAMSWIENENKMNSYTRGYGALAEEDLYQKIQNVCVRSPLLCTCYPFGHVFDAWLPTETGALTGINS